MSSILPPHPGPNPAGDKQMSSRLMTMKFMQRASSANSTPYRSKSQTQTPTSEPASKRQRIGDYTPISSGANTPTSESKVFVDKSDIRAALRAESVAEALAASRRAELGFGASDIETQWVLNVKVLTQARSGENELEEDLSENEEQDDAWGEFNGRQTYGSFKRTKKSAGTTSQSRSTAHDSTTINPGSDFDEEEDDDDEGEIGSDEESEDNRPSPSQSRKRKARTLDLTNDAAMSALDKVDLSKSSYARLKGTNAPAAKSFSYGGNRKEKRGDKHPKNNKNQRGKHSGKNKKK